MSNRVWVALWTPTVTTLGAVIVASISAWSGCSDVSRDVRAMRDAIEMQTRAIDSLAKRVDALERR